MPPWCGVAGDPARSVLCARRMVIMLRSLAQDLRGEGVTRALDAQALWDCDLDGLTALGDWKAAAQSTSDAKSARRERSPRASVTWPLWAQP